MGSGSSLSDIDDLLDLAPSAFTAAQQDYLVALKQNFDSNGNLRGALPTSAIVSEATAEWANRIDDLVRGLHQRTRGEVRIGEFDTPENDHEAALLWDSATSRVQLRNAADNGWRDLQLDNLFLAGGPRIIHRNGSPEGNEVAGSGSVCLDYTTDNGRAWLKTTSAGNTGWVELGSGGKVTQILGWTASANTLYYLPFGNNTESGTLGAQHLYRVPIEGTVSRVSIVSANDLGSCDLFVRESDGTTNIDSALGVSSVAEGSFWAVSFSLAASVSTGDVICIALDTTFNSGQCTAVLEIDP